MALIKTRSRVIAPALSVSRLETKAKKTPAPPQKTPEPEPVQEPETTGVLYEWQAQEHGYAPTSARWYVVLAIGVTLAAGLLVFLGNILGAVAVGLIGALIYFLAQRAPAHVRYRILVDGVALNDRLYAYQDLAAFNIVYEPGRTKTLIIRSKKMLSPLIQLEIGAADPLEIRTTLLEFLPEDLTLREPVTDTWARRLGF